MKENLITLIKQLNNQGILDLLKTSIYVVYKRITKNEFIYGNVEFKDLDEFKGIIMNYVFDEMLKFEKYNGADKIFFIEPSGYIYARCQTRPSYFHCFIAAFNQAQSIIRSASNYDELINKLDELTNVVGIDASTYKTVTRRSDEERFHDELVAYFIKKSDANRYAKKIDGHVEKTDNFKKIYKKIESELIEQ